MNIELLTFTGHSIVAFKAPDPFEGLTELLATIESDDDE